METITAMLTEWKQGENGCDWNGIVSRTYSHGHRHALNFEPHDDHVCAYT